MGDEAVRTGLDRIWAGWRLAYVESVADADSGLDPTEEGSLFERILASGLPDAETHIVHRGETCFAILNRYPYSSGHLLVLPNRAVPDLPGLTETEHTELWAMVRDAAAALTAAYDCDGINIGMNLGRAAGAGVPDHVHAHVLPRWIADSNFMTATAETRVLPEALGSTWEKLTAAWPIR